MHPFTGYKYIRLYDDGDWYIRDEILFKSNYAFPTHFEIPTEGIFLCMSWYDVDPESDQLISGVLADWLDENRHLFKLVDHTEPALAERRLDKMIAKLRLKFNNLPLSRSTDP